MDMVWKCAGIAVLGAILALTVRKQSAEFAVLVSMATAAALGILALELLSPVLSFARTLQETAELGEGAVAPVMKTLAIGLVTELGKNICEDAGEKTLGSVLGLAGGLGAFYVMLPLMGSVLELLRQML